jgi:hypothetical protein
MTLVKHRTDGIVAGILFSLFVTNQAVAKTLNLREVLASAEFNVSCRITAKPET